MTLDKLFKLCDTTFFKLIKYSYSPGLSVIKLDNTWVGFTQGWKAGKKSFTGFSHSGWLHLEAWVVITPCSKGFLSNFRSFFLGYLLPQPLWIFVTFVCTVLIHICCLNTSTSSGMFGFFFLSFFLYWKKLESLMNPVWSWLSWAFRKL